MTSKCSSRMRWNDSRNPGSSSTTRITGRRLREPSLETGGRSCAVMVARLYHFTPIVDSQAADGPESPGETDDPVMARRRGPGCAGAAGDGRGESVTDGAAPSDVSVGPG